MNQEFIETRNDKENFQNNNNMKEIFHVFFPASQDIFFQNTFAKKNQIIERLANIEKNLDDFETILDKGNNFQIFKQKVGFLIFFSKI